MSRIGQSSRPRNRSIDAALALADEAAGDQLLGGEPQAAQVLGERVPALRREADAEVLGGRLVEAALGEELPARRRPSGVASCSA